VLLRSCCFEAAEVAAEKLLLVICQYSSSLCLVQGSWQFLVSAQTQEPVVPQNLSSLPLGMAA